MLALMLALVLLSRALAAAKSDPPARAGARIVLGSGYNPMSCGPVASVADCDAKPSCCSGYITGGDPPVTNGCDALDDFADGKCQDDYPLGIFQPWADFPYVASAS